MLNKVEKSSSAIVSSWSVSAAKSILSTHSASRRSWRHGSFGTPCASLGMLSQASCEYGECKCTMPRAGWRPRQLPIALASGSDLSHIGSGLGEVPPHAATRMIGQALTRPFILLHLPGHEGFVEWDMRWLLVLGLVASCVSGVPHRPLVVDDTPYGANRRDIRAWHLRHGWCMGRVWAMTDEFVRCDERPEANPTDPPIF